MPSSRLARAALAACLPLAVSVPALAQQRITLPEASQHARVLQTVGVTDIEIDYHRPRVNGRKVWGALVPYDQVWRAGANDNTTIAFSHPVKVEGKELPAGSYGLHMIPTAKTWTVIFSKNATSWGSFSYREDEDALRVTVTPEKAAFVEALSYGFEDPEAASVTASLRWEELEVPFRIETDTDANVVASVANELRHLPGFSWQAWSQAANYLVGRGVELEQALAWADRSIGMQRNYQNLKVKAQILEKQGQKAEADKLNAEAMGLATEGDINALGYTHLQAGELDKAIEVFEKNAKAHPASWNVHDSLAEAYGAKGATEKSLKSYTKALELAPADQKARIEGAIKALKGSQS